MEWPQYYAFPADIFLKRTIVDAGVVNFDEAKCAPSNERITIELTW